MLDVRRAHAEAMNWREHVRIVAIILNGLLAWFMFAWGWWMPTGFGIPMIAAAIVAIIALITLRRQNG